MFDVLYVSLSILLQLLGTLGLVVLFGFVIAALNRAFYSHLYVGYRPILYITGCIGTPIHELSHATMAIIFGHKVTEVKLFQPNSEDGTLGYICHTYNQRSLYQRMGNFFIGVAPVIMGFAIVTGLMYLLVPDLVIGIYDLYKDITYSTPFEEIFESIKMTFVYIFESFISWQWWVFLLISTFIVLHMTLSKPDITGALSGVTLVILLSIVINIILYVVSFDSIEALNNMVLVFMSIALSLFMVFIIIFLIMLLIEFIVNKIARKI